MANLLDFLFEQEKPLDRTPALTKMVGLSDEVVADPISKKISGKEGSLVQQESINKLRQKTARPISVSDKDNAEAVDNVLGLKRSLGIGDAETIADSKALVDMLKDRLAKAKSGGMPTAYSTGALVTGNKALAELASQYEPKDKEVAGISKELLDAIKAHGALKKEEDAKAVDLYKNQFQEKYLKALSKASASAGLSLKDQELNARLENKASDEISKITKPFSEAQQKFSTMKQGFAAGDYQTMMNQLSNFSRFVSGEKGVLTDADIQRVLPRSGITDWAKLQAYFSKTPTARIPPEFARKMIDLVNIAEEKTADKFKKDFKQKKSGWLSPNSTYQRVSGTVNDLIKNAETDYFPEKQAAPAPMDGGLLNSSAAQEWLKKKRGGGK